MEKAGRRLRKAPSNRRAGRPPRALGVLSWLHGGLLVAVFAILHLRAEVRWPNSLLAYVPQWSWLAIPVFLGVWSAFARRWPVFALNGAILVFAAVGLGGCALGTGSPAPTGDTEAFTRVRILTWNLHNEYRHRDLIAGYIKRWEPDIVCLQESGAGAFDDLCPGWYQTRVGSQRVNSRWEVRDFKMLRIPTGHTMGITGCDVLLPDGPLRVLNIHVPVGHAQGQTLRIDPRTAKPHLRSAVRSRSRKADEILRVMPHKGPAVLCGDFNTPPTSAIYRRLRGHLTDSFASTRFGLGLTYLIRKKVPAWRIDYVWCGNGVRPVDCQVGNTQISDHRPVIADVLVPREDD